MAVKEREGREENVTLCNKLDSDCNSEMEVGAVTTCCVWRGRGMGNGDVGDHGWCPFLWLVFDVMARL